MIAITQNRGFVPAEQPIIYGEVSLACTLIPGQLPNAIQGVVLAVGTGEFYNADTGCKPVVHFAAPIAEAAAFAGVEEELFERSPLELSGGQKRRIAIAGVIAMRPRVLILDEPTAGLDPAGCRQILENICAYREKTGSTVIVVSHNMDDMARIAERLIVFSDGGVLMDGTPEEVFAQPEKLVEHSLAVPRATALAMELRRQGMALEGSIYTHEQLKEAVLKARGVG